MAALMKSGGRGGDAVQVFYGRASCVISISRLRLLIFFGFLKVRVVVISPRQSGW
jgi:hypothetical protein